MHANISITLGGPLADALNNLAAAMQAIAAINKAQEQRPAPEPAAAVKTEKPAKPGKAESRPKDEPADTVAVSVTIPGIAELRAAADAVVEKHGVQPVKAMLAELGVAKLADIEEARRAEALALLKGML
ncbi:MAG: hypothetical protein N3C59_10580 [Azovibrio sp.]|nr:hypothetical protein [Azovibrio sp.]